MATVAIGTGLRMGIHPCFVCGVNFLHSTTVAIVQFGGYPPEQGSVPVSVSVYVNKPLVRTHHSKRAGATKNYFVPNMLRNCRVYQHILEVKDSLLCRIANVN